MKGEIIASVAAIAAAVMLAACASKGPTSSMETASTDATGAGANAQDKAATEYQRLIDNASEQRICKRKAVTGSRINSVVCMTRAEMEEQRQRADEVMRDMRDSAAARQQMPDRPPMPPSPPPTRQ